MKRLHIIFIEQRMFNIIINNIIINNKKVNEKSMIKCNLFDPCSALLSYLIMLFSSIVYILL